MRPGLYHLNSMDRQTKDALRTFLIALAIVFVALFIMALVLGYIWSKVPVPQLDNGAGP